MCKAVTCGNICKVTDDFTKYFIFRDRCWRDLFVHCYPRDTTTTISKLLRQNTPEAKIGRNVKLMLYVFMYDGKHKM